MVNYIQLAGQVVFQFEGWLVSQSTSLAKRPANPKKQIGNMQENKLTIQIRKWKRARKQSGNLQKRWSNVGKRSVNPEQNCGKGVGEPSRIHRLFRYSASRQANCKSRAAPHGTQTAPKTLPGGKYSAKPKLSHGFCRLTVGNPLVASSCAELLSKLWQPAAYMSYASAKLLTRQAQYF